MTKQELKEFLDGKVELYNRPAFIASDPVSIPRQFTAKEDIEIAGFLSATIAWGQRPTIIRNANRLLDLMDRAPAQFVRNACVSDLKPFKTFVHRTFNGDDAIFFIRALQNIYLNHGGLQNAFSPVSPDEPLFSAIIHFRELFFETKYSERSRKHVSNPAANSAAKRLCMYLRWMIRKDQNGVDFGIWNSPALNSSHLMCPLDVHSGNVSRKLGLLSRKQDDWKAVVELTDALRTLDPKDPVKYDFALFGLGVFEKF